MKKEGKRLAYYIILFCALSIVVLSFLFPAFFMKYILAPALSPFFPDFAPFEASVSIKQNTPPLIIDFNNEYFVCEGNFTNIFFNVSDEEKDPITMDIAPKNPFFISPPSSSGGKLITEFKIVTFRPLRKADLNPALGYRRYPEFVTASDGQLSGNWTNITLIGINNKPNVEILGVQTVYRVGDNITFDKQVSVSDVEDVNENSGRLIFDLTFLDGVGELFNISANGTMFFDPNVSLNFSVVSIPVTYNMSLCVNDSALTSVHPMIQQECGQDGRTNKVCQTFSLTITDENRPPTITTHYPFDLNFSINGDNEIYFNISDRDPDGTIPDTYWYADGLFLEYDNMSAFDEFRYVFGCGVSGLHKIKVDSTDGLLNDSLVWNVSVGLVECPSGGGGGGGGGGTRQACKEEWICYDYNVCQNLDKSLDGGLIQGNEYREFKDACKIDFISEDKCGFQIRDCLDINSCNKTLLKPEEVEDCFYVENPSCEDGVKDCHDGGCELLVDCGGPCGACPTCSDGIKNQNELEADCGGPCPNICPEKPSFIGKFNYSYIFWILIIILLIIVIIQIIRILKAKEKVSRDNFDDAKIKFPNSNLH